MTTNRHELNIKAFFELLRAGLWEKEAQLSEFKDIDYATIMKLAEDQSLVGLITAGLEHVQDVKIPQVDLLQFIGNTMQIEQRNKAMNDFIKKLYGKFGSEGIYSLLVKGQGIAQCYEKPLWRSCGDVDLFLDETNYRKAQKALIPLAYDIEEENPSNLHQAMNIGEWCVELHGTLRSQLGKRVNNGIDKVQEDTFRNKRVRVWINNETDVFLPAPDNDVIFVFTHILQHFFGGGIGLRQICDWCRLLWTYRAEIDHRLLKSRLLEMGLIPQWKAFASLAVNTLGMPMEAMPLYSDDKKWEKKAERILTLIFETGNFGHGRDMSHKQKYPKVIEYLISFGIYTRYSIRQFMIFPIEAMIGWGRLMKLGVKSKMKK